MRCARCEFTGDLAEHAPASGHWPCVCCNRSLAEHETQTCTRCVARVRTDLADIVELFAMLPAQAHALPSGWRTGARGSGEGMPGGDALVLLAPGANRWIESPDERTDDTPSVLHVLATWEDDVRAALGHHGAGPATIVSCTNYLSSQAGRIGREHPAVDELFRDVHKLVGRLRAQLRASDEPIPAGADCLTCGAGLVREWITTGPSKGLSDERVCPRCRRRYGWVEFLLAARAKAEVSDVLVTVPQYAVIAGVEQSTVRTWIDRRRIVACVDRTERRYRYADLDTARQHMPDQRREAS